MSRLRVREVGDCEFGVVAITHTIFFYRIILVITYQNGTDQVPLCLMGTI
jgi:hypothetical protein